MNDLKNKLITFVKSPNLIVSALAIAVMILAGNVVYLDMRMNALVAVNEDAFKNIAIAKVPYMKFDDGTVVSIIPWLYNKVAGLEAASASYQTSANPVPTPNKFNLK